ncbi:FecR family protein [Tamlana sp. 2201CG12-4]|uniref:FecR family protein n=1 Tax=Tamlana sp. 2201CG12-4 TaxID=3112582 RepID=UPI002DB7306D|nr:FecR family protein [Tamlana sp. 2201CG12-4]MEC3906735.1 FecR family protein [Tamlana sp. 2201CG12-4]
MSKKSKNTDLESKFNQYWDESMIDSLNMDNSEAVFDAISQELDFQDNSISLVSRYGKLLKYAAIFVVLISIGAYFTFTNNSTIDIDKDSILKIALNQQKIRLDDNSEVELFPNSKLTYPTVFNDSIRKVELEGSALFNITKDDKKPFLVHQGDLITKVLGTKFLIEEDSMSQLTKIYLHTGKIAVTNKGNTFNRVLLPGDSLIYNQQTNKELIEKVKPKEDKFIAANKAIKNKISIEFVNVKLKDAYKRIQEQTGIQIDYSDVGIDGELILSLDYKDKTIEKVIEDLNSFNAFTYRIENNTIIIKK